MKYSIRRHKRNSKRTHQPQSVSEEDSQEYSVTNPDNSGQQSSYSSYSGQESNNLTDDHNNNNNNNGEEEEGGTYASSSSSSYSVPYPNYINVAPLPMFHGDRSECPVSHLSRFRLVCHANNAASTSALLRIFPVTLQSYASLWYEAFVDPDETVTWEKIQEGFVGFFIRPETVQNARVRLMSLRQEEEEEEEETVGRYYLRMRRLMKQWPEHGLSDGLLKGLFVDGLREELREWVVGQMPDTLDEAVAVARKLEGAQSFSRGGISKQRCGFCEGEGHGERECEGRRRMKEVWMMRRRGEEEEKVEEGNRRLGRVVSLMERRPGGQCQCWKHQCWNSKIKRSGSSVVSDKNVAVDQP